MQIKTILNQAFFKTVFLFVTYLRLALKIPGIGTNHTVQNLQLPEFHGHTMVAVIIGLEEKTQEVI